MIKYFYNIIVIVLFIAINIWAMGYVYSQQNEINDEILAGRVIIKIKPEYREFCLIDNINHSVLSNVLENINFDSCAKIFPLSSKPATEYNRYGQKLVDLSLIYEVFFDKQIPVYKIIANLQKSQLLEYAVPHVLPKTLYVPSDPGATNQYHLNIIKAFDAWDISKGDTSIVIGIIDTGTDWEHTDLTGNIYYNYNDPPNGTDDDNDGYIDNFRGWDMGDNDNNPLYDTDPHGVHVSGIAAAKTDNGIGVAGVGFKTRFLPVKISDSDNNLIHSYEGIVYAADHGCDVINCSWGGTANPGAYGQDIINYAVYNHDAVVVAACGNDNNELPFYPASLNNVISVAATDQYDLKNSTSNYGIYVDLCAPGKNIFSTWTNGSYTNYSGTSMSAPIVSGCAAIVKSVFPNYNAIQIGEKLRATADLIDTIGTNTIFTDKLGSGRVNLFKSLTQSTPSVRIVELSTEDGNDNIYVANENIMITADFINYLDDASNLTINISSESPYIDITQPFANIGNLPAMAIKNNNSNPFIISVLQSMPAGTHNVEIKVQYSATSYSSFEYFTIKLNKDYVDITSGLTETTVSSRGKIGFNDYYASEGIGLRFRNSKNILYCGGLMMGSSQGQVSDNVYSATGGYDEDFLPLTNIAESEFIGNGYTFYTNKFNDASADVTSMGLEIEQKVTAYTHTDSSKFIIFDYYIKNKSQSILPDFYAGMFIDWDIANCYANRTLWDASLNLSYTFPVAGGIYGGIMLVSPDNAKTYAFDADGSANSIEIYDGFSAAEKYAALSTNRFSAGQGNNGNDIASMVSSGPFNLKAGDSINVVFALLAGDNYYDIKNSASMVNDKYFNISDINIFNNNKYFDVNIFPNPAKNFFTINMNLPESRKVKIQLFNIIGQLQELLSDEYMLKGNHQIIIDTKKFNPGVYFCEIESGNITKTIKLILQ